MSNNYNILAKTIVGKYIASISGDDIVETFVDDSFMDRVMVGMLSENRVDDSFEGGYVEKDTTRFESVPSLTVTFIVKKNSSGVLNVIPKGLLFYSVNPDYNKTVDFIINRYSEKDNYKYSDISQLCEAYPEEKFNLPLTYKKIKIQDYMGSGIEIHLDDIKGKSFHLEDEINDRLTFLAEKIMDEVCITKTEKITLFDLLNEGKFNAVTCKKEEKVMPKWDIDIYCTVSDEEQNLRFTLQMVNKTMITGKGNIGYIPKIFDAGIEIIGNENIEFVDIKLDYFVNSFKEHSLIYAVSENTSAAYYPEKNSIITDNIPIYYQMRLKTKDEFNKYVTFEKLIDDPIVNLNIVNKGLQVDYEKCRHEYETTSFKSSIAKAKCENALTEYEHEIHRFERGIEQIEYKDYVKKAFVCMNRTFQLKFVKETRPLVGWRLFQIVFIVSMICEMIRSEYPEDSTLGESDIPVANLLYFPTGGGKTEAFLGACVFDMFFDRLRGKNIGISAFLKYPLRLLAVQQLDRILTVVMKANVIRENNTDLKNSNIFQVGFFVGKSNTPNKIGYYEKLSDRGNYSAPQEQILDSDSDTLNEYYKFIDTCPYCGGKSVTVRFNKDYWRLEHICENKNCPVDVLPLLIVDNEIYRYMPSIVVSTIDKMAMIGTTSEFKMLFGQVKSKCKIHGFSNTTKCLCPACSIKDEMVRIDNLKDPIPTLFIQDELHLVKESLGTFDSHYESFIDYYARKLVPENQRKQIRFIGATATISNYKGHIHELYHMEGRRFPCEYPSVKKGEDFYSYTDYSDITRIILGYAPYGRSITDGVWQSAYIMRVIVYRMIQHYEESYKEILKYGFVGSIEDYKKMLYDYWIELVYNNRKQDVSELENAFQNQANNYLEAKAIPKYVIRQMTSDVDFQSVRKALFNIRENREKDNSTNLLLATSTISHGVDEDSFNVMYFFGMPNNNAEYIQAYSRTGRKYTGIVIDIIRMMRIRDRSYLKNFIVFHQNRDDLVESVPINRWAKNAIYSTLPGMFTGLIMQYYAGKTGIDNMIYAIDVKKMLLDGTISKDDVIDKLILAYGCSNHEKMSLAYIDIIKEEMTVILDGIQNGNFKNNEFLSQAIEKTSTHKKGPMTSLRDTEEQIEIKLR